jgi:hypothetical protein
VVPIAVAPRVAHVRVPEPLAVHEWWREGAAEAERAGLLSELRTRLQGALDTLLAELEPEVAPFRRANPFRLAAEARQSS